ncbi:glycosyltransferase [Vreelandella profundi]|uniref:glycosyltransferase n=1 Tax=Vreelandella profundi TaxID=2852117 RepID=UPI001EF159A6|nr:glycosyltransferase [Halomonas profundi]
MARALIVLPTAIMGGAERVLFNVAHEFLAQGHYVTIYIMSRGRQPNWDVLESHPNCVLIVREFSSEKSSLLSFFYYMRKISADFNPTFVFSTHTHINAALSFLRYIRILKCDFLVSRESTFIFERFFGLKRFLFHFLYRFFYGAQDLLIYQTKNMKNSLESALNCEPVKNSLVLENPVSLSFIDSSLESIMLSPKKSNRLVACGRLIPIKGFGTLIKAFSEVLKYHPESVLEIVGDGPERQKLETLVCDLNLEGRVIFHGRVENPFFYYQGATMGIVSSIKEGFPNVLIEMMASGVGSLVTTPCTDGVYSLPNIEVAGGVDEDSIFHSINSVLNNYNDKSSLYREYVEADRSVTQFINKIFLACGYPRIMGEDNSF